MGRGEGGLGSWLNECRSVAVLERPNSKPENIAAGHVFPKKREGKGNIAAINPRKSGALLSLLSVSLRSP